LVQIAYVDTAAPIREVFQPLGVRLHRLGVFQQGLLRDEPPDRFDHSDAVGIVVLFHCHTLRQRIEHGLLLSHCFDRRLKLASGVFVATASAGVERSGIEVGRAPTAPLKVHHHVAASFLSFNFSI